MSAPLSMNSASSSNSASKKKRKNKKKAAAAKAESNEGSLAANGTPGAQDVDAEEGDVEDDEPESPTKTPADDDEAVEAVESPGPSVPDPASTNSTTTTNGIHETASEYEERLDALAKERDSLRAEVTSLRKSLEDIQGKHEEQVSGLQEQLEESHSSKEHAESQYRNLLGKVNTIKAQLGERLKADAEEISQARAQIEELESQNTGLREANESLQADVSRLSSNSEQQAQEIASLRSRASLSQQNWIQERDDLIQREAYAREEFENAKQAMQDWEVLAMEERSLRENLSERVAELEEQLSSHREAYEKAAAERDSQNLTVDGLQRALQDIQDARKQELRELVQNSQAQLEELRKQVQAAEETSTSAQAALETMRKELERALPFEKEVKEKNLLIGKLRHEAVILNDHLTKALRILKKGRPEDNVDRQIVTNHLLHFLALDRSDPKKFQVLQLIAALLGWNDEQREAAGLARPGASTGSLRLPLSPFRRTPSTPSLNTELLMNDNRSGSVSAESNKESLAELWSNFLEQEAREGTGASRRGSLASGRGGKERSEGP
ncbi:hypothetical protein H2201_004730 [Coniosporium apollinis]|uniref:GRIP domain-containing protein n=2 Tax=Coniosporium TaxID=2810619 RepID=A0ABQ9NRN2_9PEZI|nr:hypothetical protein H2199_004719 [Cladosporium sp. JES 115]KAJ9665070.1 hypothetical protein H2201_004730 [Coniosporium apollinis]